MLELWMRCVQSQIQFKDGAGKTIKLNAGQTWVTALADPSLVSYTP